MSERLRGSRTPVFVVLNDGLQYGFQRGSKAAELGSEFGHSAVTGNTRNIFFGANAPKPMRFTRKIGGANARSITSFASDSKAQELLGNKAQYTLAHPGLSLQATNSKFKTMVNIDLGSYRYAWKMDKNTASTLAQQLSSAGVTPGVTTKCVFGSRPAPPRGTILVGEQRYSSFIAPSKITEAAAAGWSVRGRAAGVAGA